MEQNLLLSIALDHLTLGRAALYRAILEHADFQLPPKGLEHINQAVTSLRRAGRSDHIPLGLLTRAWLRSLTGPLTGPDSSQSDLDEAWEIAERGPMPLFLADIHLYRARLLGRVKDDGGNIRPNPTYPWDSPQKDLAEARRLIEKHGYWRRKEELEDAEAFILSHQNNLRSKVNLVHPRFDPFLLTFWLVLERLVPVELLAAPEAGGIREAMLKLSPDLRGQELVDDVLGKLADKYAGISPNSLWHSWIRTGREKDEEALRAAIIS